MSGALQGTDHHGPEGAEATTLVQRFWLSFIRSITEPHLSEDGGNARRLLEGRLAENVDKAVAAALEGRPPHKCGSFGRAALSVMRSRQLMEDDPVRFPGTGGRPGSSR